MPPKLSAPASGQKSLFSFFTKKAPASTPVAVSSTSAADCQDTTKSFDHSRILDTPPVNIQPTKSLSDKIFSSGITTNEKSITTKPETNDKITAGKSGVVSSLKRSRVIMDDDDDEQANTSSGGPSSFTVNSNTHGAPKNLASKFLDEEEWNPSDSEAASMTEAEDDDDEFVVSNDESEGSGDDDEDLAESSDEDKPVLKKRARPCTTSQGSAPKALGKPPRSAAAAAPKIISSAPNTSGKKSSYETPISSSSRPSNLNSSGGLYERMEASNGFLTSTPMNTDADSLTQSQSQTNKIFELPEGVMGRGSHEHNFFTFLKSPQRKDKMGRKSDHPDFNPRTLDIPNIFVKSLTPAMEQWWQFKSENMDTVLFFKVGKFYELFHMDADIGMQELDLIYMKGAKAHSGFPEVSYGKFASALVSKGYRVARVEQTETPDQLKERNELKGGKKDKVVIRELCSVMSKGTRTFCHLDDISLLEDDSNSGAQSDSVLVCIMENKASSSDLPECDPEYGVCAVDTVIGTITLGQFQDDQQRSRLRAFLARVGGSEILVPSTNSNEVLGTVRLIIPKAAITKISGEDYPDPKGTIDLLQKGKYFPNGELPTILDAVIAGLEDGSSELVVNAFGGALCYLKRALIDFEIISMGKILAYIPSDEEQQIIAQSDLSDKNTDLDPHPLFSSASLVESTTTKTNNFRDAKAMTLDAIALTNLEILVNNYDRTEKGSLWSFLNRCQTSFGRRLLKDWLCRPLFQPSDITKRREAVDELITGLSTQSDAIRKLLKSVPDLERLLSRVHSNGLRSKGVNHPDSRAVMYEAHIYNTRKIKDFADTLAGFDVLLKIGAIVENVDIRSPLLKKILKSPSQAGDKNGGKFPMKDMSTLLKFYREIFDEKQAKRDGNIKPRAGVDPDYDQAKKDIAASEAFFEEYIREIKKQTGINDMKYFGTNKDRYQLEIPMNMCSKVPRDWTSKSQKKTHRRYWTPTIEEKLAELTLTEERLAEAQRDTLRRIFEKFDSKRDLWMDAVTCISVLDALLSLAEVSKSPSYCWPEIVSSNDTVLDIQNGRHPMVEHQLAQRGDGDYIPNTTILGGKMTSTQEYLPKLLLLSGPNMGGKSTLLRQTCLIAIMAQLGCKVPADSVRMTPVDRIFTRVGASDRILAGQSTFFVELAETTVILKHATEDSLCILDELGRGTATFDGTAIAHAVVDHLVRRNRCRTLFATHYHSLVSDWEMDPRVKLGHMDCMVQGAVTSIGESDTISGDAEVTFLYKLCDGSSPRSYGINVARLARLPKQIIDLAMKQSKEFEDRMKASVGSYQGSSCGAVTATRDLVTSYFERLVSIAHSEMGLDELAFVAEEIWRRWLSVATVN